MGKKAKSASRKSTNSAAALKRAREARKLFEQGLVARGEAGKRDKKGKLPPGVTHELAEGEFVRRRFSAV